MFGYQPGGSRGLDPVPSSQGGRSPGADPTGRSRSPGTRTPAWTSGDPDLDHSFSLFAIDPELLQQFGVMFPMKQRARIMRSMTMLESSGKMRAPDGYLRGCLARGPDPPPASPSTARSPARVSNAGGSPSVSPGGASSAHLQNSEQVEQAAGAHTAAAPPQCIVDMAAAVREPADFLELFERVQSAQVVAWFASLDGPTSLNVAWAFMLGFSWSGELPEAFGEQLRARYQALFQQDQEVPRALDTPARPRVSLQLMLCGPTIATNVAVVTSILQQFQRGINGVEILPKPPIIVHGLYPWSQLTTDCAAELGQPPVAWSASPSFVTMEINDNLAQWRADNTKFLLLTVATHVMNAAPMALNLFAPADMHGINAHTFAMLGVSDALRRAVGDDNVAEAVMVPPPCSDHVAKLWGGEMQFTRPEHWLPVRPVPRVFGVPSNVRIVPNVVDGGNNDQPIDGLPQPVTHGLPSVQHENGLRPSLLARAASNQWFACQDQASEDLATMERLRVSDPNGVRVMPSRAWWLRWYCLQPEMSAKVYAAAYPCVQGPIRCVNGKAAGPNDGGVAANVTKCGHKRYCHNCQEVFKHLDRGFVEASMADTAIAMTANCVTHWAGRPGQQPLVWGRPTDPGRSHVCKGTCIGI